MKTSKKLIKKGILNIEMFNLMIILTPSLTRVLITSLVLGFLAGSFGVFIVLKKQALVGDSLAHAALPGVVITFLIFQTKRLEVLLIGAAISGMIAIFILNVVKKYSKIKNDAVLAIILAGFFGLGRALLSVVQRRGGSGSAGLEQFIFGQTATILLKDMYLIIGVAVLTNILIALFWKELKLSIFNHEFFETLGFNSKIMDYVFSILIVLVVIAGIQMVGIVLISSLLIAPAVTARQWSHRLSVNFFMAGIIGAISGVIGVLIADNYSLPPGPTIIIILSIIVTTSILFAPRNGIIVKTFKGIKYRKQLEKYTELVNFYYHDLEDISIRPELDYYLSKGLIEKDNNQFVITNKGLLKIKDVIGERKDE